MKKSIFAKLAVVLFAAVLFVGGAVIIVQDAQARPICVYYEGAGTYCVGEEGWCWYYDDGGRDCGYW